MRHSNANRKFGRERNQRKALLRTLAVSLIDHETIKTTEAKAKELRPFVERILTNARKNTLSSRRHVISELGSEKMAGKLVSVLGPRYEGRPGGYLRVVKMEPRKHDAAKMALIQFV